MKLHSRLDRLEDDLHDTVRRIVADVVAVLTRELTVPERRAFLRVAKRVLALREAGVDCPGLPTERDVIVDGASVRLPDGAVLASVAEWTGYCAAAIRVKELWRALDGPSIGLDTEPDQNFTGGTP